MMGRRNTLLVLLDKDSERLTNYTSAVTVKNYAAKSQGWKGISDVVSTAHDTIPWTVKATDHQEADSKFNKKEVITWYVIALTHKIRLKKCWVTLVNRVAKVVVLCYRSS